MRKERMSVLSEFTGIMELLTTRIPSFRSMGANFSREGWFMTTTAFGDEISGDPIGLSAITTVQLAVPPRISGPYEGSQVTSFPSSSPAYARSFPIIIRPCPPKPDMITSVCISRSFL